MIGRRDKPNEIGEFGSGTFFSDIFPNVGRVIEKYIGEMYNPDDHIGL